MTTSTAGSTPTTALVVISDRDDLYLPRCLAALDQFGFPFAQRIILQDPRHEMDQNEVVVEAWSRVDDNVDFVFHLEEDFVLHELPIAAMARTLDANPDLAHVVLKRQAWSDVEHQAGGIIECFPDSYEDCDGFMKHRRFFSLNPSLIPKSTIDLGWAGSEGDMTDRCVDKGLSFAFYGARHDPPRCTHIGEVRR